MLKNYYKALNYILVKLRIIKIVIGRLLRVKMTMFSFAVESMIRGYHKGIWEIPSADDDRLCELEVGNAHDTHVHELLLEKISLARLQQWLSRVC